MEEVEDLDFEEGLTYVMELIKQLEWTKWDEEENLQRDMVNIKTSEK